nr:hypothetical protein Iba_chr09bCG0010 [Ipomoea batatas]
MAEPLGAPPSKKGPATGKRHLDQQSVAEEIKRKATSEQKLVDGKGGSTNLERSKKKVNRKLAMEAPIATDQKKAISDSELKESEAKETAPIEPIGAETAPIEPTGAETAKSETNESKESAPMDPTEEQSEKSESKAQDSKGIDESLSNSVLNMMEEIDHLKTEMLENEFKEMCDEIGNLARQFASEHQVAEPGENPKEALRDGILAIAERFVRESKLRDAGRTEGETEQQMSNESNEAESLDWQEGFSLEILEEMKGLCNVYVSAKGGLQSKEETDLMMLEIIREMKNKSMDRLQGKMIREEVTESPHTKGVSFAAPPMEEDQNKGGPASFTLMKDAQNHRNEGQKHDKQVYTNPELQNKGGLSPACEKASMSKVTLDGAELKGLQTGAAVSSGNQKVGNAVPAVGISNGFGSGPAVGTGRGRGVTPGMLNNGGNASMGWGNKQEAPPSRNASKGRFGGQTPLRGQAPKPFQQGRGPVGRQSQWKNDPQFKRQDNNKRNNDTTHAKETREGQAAKAPAVSPQGRTAEGYERGESKAIKEYEREGAEICRSENIDPGGGVERNEKEAQGGEEVTELREESEEGKLERKKGLEKEIMKSLFRAHVSPPREQTRVQSTWGEHPHL